MGPPQQYTVQRGDVRRVIVKPPIGIEAGEDVVVIRSGHDFSTASRRCLVSMNLQQASCHLGERSIQPWNSIDRLNQNIGSEPDSNGSRPGGLSTSQASHYSDGQRPEWHIALNRPCRWDGRNAADAVCHASLWVSGLGHVEKN